VRRPGRRTGLAVGSGAPALRPWGRGGCGAWNDVLAGTMRPWGRGGGWGDADLRSGAAPAERWGGKRGVRTGTSVELRGAQSRRFGKGPAPALCAARSFPAAAHLSGRGARQSLSASRTKPSVLCMEASALH